MPWNDPLIDITIIYVEKIKKYTLDIICVTFLCRLQSIFGLFILPFHFQILSIAGDIFSLRTSVFADVFSILECIRVTILF